MRGADVTIAGPDGQFGGYLATPDGDSGPGVVVIQEVFGVNAVMRGIADALAAEGFVALCPDLFWRQEPGLRLSDQTATDLARAFALYEGFDVDGGVRDIAVTLDHLRGESACSNRVGAIGFCLGGLLAYLATVRTSSECAVGYYGVGIDQKLSEAASISAPLMLHVATGDEFVPPEAQQAIHGGLDANPRVTIHDYDGLGHAFARPGSTHYDAAAAELANGRTTAFLRANLG